jgi:hypothetical protein
VVGEAAVTNVLTGATHSEALVAVAFNVTAFGVPPQLWGVDIDAGQ